MNILTPKDEKVEPILSFTYFNQDNSSLVIGCKTGFKIINLKEINKTITKIFEFSCCEPIIVERLFSTSLVIIVEKNYPLKISLLHLRKKSLICSYTYASSVVSCKLNRTSLVVCLEDSLVLHNIKDMKVEHTIHDIPLNTSYVFCLSPHNKNSYLAYPGSNQLGNVFIFDAANLRFMATLEAHESLLAAMSFNTNGEMLATSSIKGTVIRVFAIPSGAKVYEFRRGVKRCVTINCLSFSGCSEYLACSSNTETVHVFKLDIKQQNEKNKESTWMNSLSNALMSSASYLPTPVADMLVQERDHARAIIPSVGLRNICGIIRQENEVLLLVCNEVGRLFIFQMSREGGECKLMSEHDLNNLFLVPKTTAQCFEVPTMQPSQLPGLTVYSPTNLQSPTSNINPNEYVESPSESGEWTSVKKGWQNKTRTTSPDWVPSRGTYADVVVCPTKPTDAEVKVEDLYEDAGDGWLDDPAEFPPFFGF